MTYALSKTYGFGSTLACDPAGGTSYGVLGAIVDGWEESEAKADEINTAVLGDRYRTKASGQVDPGSCTFDICYDPTTGSSAAILGALLTSGAIAGWQTTVNTSSGPTHSAFVGPVVGLGVSVKKGALVMQKVTVAKSGNPGFIGA